jgi:hypothetical protein
MGDFNGDNYSDQFMGQLVVSSAALGREGVVLTFVFFFLFLFFLFFFIIIIIIIIIIFFFFFF